MFCPKCGFQNPDDAAFCGNCGASFGGRTVSKDDSKPVKAANPDSGAASVESANTIQSGNADGMTNAERLAQAVKASKSQSADKTAVAGQPNDMASAFGGGVQKSASLESMLDSSKKWLIAVVGGALTIVLMFMPWISISEDLYNVINGLGGLAGAISGNYISMNASYSLWGLADMLSQTSFSSLVDEAMFGYRIPWVVALLFILVGMVKAFISPKSTKLLGAGCAVVTLLVLWTLFYTPKCFDDYVFVGFWGIATLIVSAVAAVLCFLNKAQKG